MSRRQQIGLVLLSALVGAFGCASAPVAPAPAAPDLASAVKSAAGANTAVISVSHEQPCCPKQTLPQFLGITGAAKGVGSLFNCFRNKLGMAFPGLEAKPAVLAISDPANMAKDSPPAVKAAAEIKAQEDAAAQKIKALRYLATIGCGGCYPDVEAALIAAMDDCTEAVRYEAVKAIRDTTGSPCVYCACGSCCTEKIQDKLRELAFDKKGPRCCGEPSARVRRQARLALAECGPPVVVEEPKLPEEPAKPAPEAGPSERPSKDAASGPSEGSKEGDSKDADAKEGDTPEKDAKEGEANEGEEVKPDQVAAQYDWASAILSGAVVPRPANPNSPALVR